VTTGTTTTPLVNLSDPDFWEQPLAKRDEGFDLLRREQPVSWQDPPLAFAPQQFPPPRGYWAITRHADIQRVSRDADNYSAADGALLFDNLPPKDEYDAEGIMSLDPPRHTKLRGLVQKAFTPRIIERIEDQIWERARQLVAAAAPLGECDYRQIVDPLPHLMTCDLLGIPEEARDDVDQLSHIVAEASGPNGYDESLQASRDLANYAIEIARQRAANPGEDLISALVNAEVDGERFEEYDLGVMVALLIEAGGGTTADAMHEALLALDRFPSERDRLLTDFDHYAETAVEEVLRWSSPGVYIRRIANADTEIGGQKIAAGDNVVLWFRSGNRDDSVFEDPYRFDVSRSPNPHLAFGGGGRHFCLGNSLARTEIRAMLKTLLEVLPDIHLLEEPRWLPTPQLVLIDGPMPCRFTPREVV
jgi:methyl-branched lipid omega-hydroxylase